jgi:sulfate adenylyltransferase subunit 1 (EFTu-like GTPase family)
MLCRPLNHPAPRSEIDAMVFWMGDQPLAEGMRLTMRHTTRWVGVRVSSVHYRRDISTLHRDPGACALGANDIGHVTLVADHPLWADDHARVRSTGCALLVDAASGATLGALTLRGPTSPPASLRGVT